MDDIPIKAFEGLKNDFSKRFFKQPNKKFSAYDKKQTLIAVSWLASFGEAARVFENSNKSEVPDLMEPVDIGYIKSSGHFSYDIYLSFKTKRTFERDLAIALEACFTFVAFSSELSNDSMVIQVTDSIIGDYVEYCAKLMINSKFHLWKTNPFTGLPVPVIRSVRDQRGKSGIKNSSVPVEYAYEEAVLAKRKEEAKQQFKAVITEIQKAVSSQKKPPLGKITCHGGNEWDYGPAGESMAYRTSLEGGPEMKPGVYCSFGYQIQSDRQGGIEIIPLGQETSFNIEPIHATTAQASHLIFIFLALRLSLGCRFVNIELTDTPLAQRVRAYLEALMDIPCETVDEKSKERTPLIEEVLLYHHDCFSSNLGEERTRYFRSYFEEILKAQPEIYTLEQAELQRRQNLPKKVTWVPNIDLLANLREHFLNSPFCDTQEYAKALLEILSKLPTQNTYLVGVLVTEFIRAEECGAKDFWPETEKVKLQQFKNVLKTFLINEIPVPNKGNKEAFSIEMLNFTIGNYAVSNVARSSSTQKSTCLVN